MASHACQIVDKSAGRSSLEIGSDCFVAHAFFKKCMDKHLLKLLEDSGLTEKEALVYLALLELGQGDVTDISKSTGLKRSIIYVILEGLIKRGYASQLPDKKINTYQAIDPAVILGKLKMVTKNFSEMLPVFRTLRNKGKKRPKITYHETKAGIWKVYEEINNADDAFFISSYEKLTKIFPGALETWIDQYQRGIIKLQKGRHLVANNTHDREVLTRLKAVDQNVRYLEDVKEFNMDFTIYDNKLAITSLEDEPFIVVIESKALVDSMRPIFELSWERGKEPA